MFEKRYKTPRAMTDEDVAQVRAQIDLEARCGYCTEGQIVDEFRHLLEDIHEFAADDVQTWTGELERALTAQRVVEAAWSDVTHNDRIDRAFEELAERGIIAEQDVGVTMSDGWAIVGQLGEDNPAARGATFFHRQDVERGVAGEGLLLAFGAFSDGADHAEKSIALAREVCAVLQQHGVDAQWDGDLDQRIRIAPFPWRKRRTTQW